MSGLEFLTMLIDARYWIFSPNWRIQIKYSKSENKTILLYMFGYTYGRMDTPSAEIAAMVLSVVSIDDLTICPYNDTLPRNLRVPLERPRIWDHAEFKKLCNPFAEPDLLDNQFYLMDIAGRIRKSLVNQPKLK